jgi:hypothetical protein
MRKVLWSLALVAAAFVLPQIAMAAESEKAGKADKPGPKFDLKEMFQKMDKDKDGKLTVEEFTEGMKELHKAMMEHHGPMGPMPGGPMPPPPPMFGMAPHGGPSSWWMMGGSIPGQGPGPGPWTMGGPMQGHAPGPGPWMMGGPMQGQGPGLCPPGGPCPPMKQAGGPPPFGPEKDGKPLEARLKDLEAKIKALEAKVEAK